MKLILGLTTILLATTASFAYPLADDVKEEPKPAVASVPLVNSSPSKVEVVGAPVADQPSSQSVVQPAPVVASDSSSSAESSASAESQESTERLEIAATTQLSPKLEESSSDEVSNESKPQQDGENLATTEQQLPKLEEPKLEVINKPAAVGLPIEEKPEEMPLLRSAPSAGNVEGGIKAEIEPAVPVVASNPAAVEPASSDAIVAQPTAEIQPELKKVEAAEPIVEAIPAEPLPAPLETVSAPEENKLAARSSAVPAVAEEQPQPTQVVETVVVPEEAKIAAKSSPLAEDPKISPVVEAISVGDAAAQRPVALAEEPVPLAKSDDSAAVSSEELTTTERVIEEKPLALPTQQEVQKSEDVKREVPLGDSVIAPETVAAVETKEELVQPSEKKLEATPITAQEIVPSETKLVEELANKPIESETKIDEAKPIVAPSGDLKPQEPALVLAEEKPAAVELAPVDEKKKAKSDEASDPASVPLSTTEAQLSSTTIVAGVPTTLEGLNAGNIVREEVQQPAQPISS